jgi:hypothetical protein
MVYSHLNKSIEYPETREIDPEDIDHISSIYLLEIYGKPHTVAIGKVKYTFSVTYEVVYFPIYLVRNTKIVGKIGVYELERNRLLSVMDKNKEPKVANLGEPVWFSKTTEDYMKKTHSVYEDIEGKKEKDIYTVAEEPEEPIKKVVEDEDDISDKEEDVLSLKKPKELEKEKNIEKEKEKRISIDDVFTKDKTQPNVATLPTETEEESKKEKEEYEKTKSLQDNWIQTFMKNKGYAIKRNEGGGDCFFAVIRDAFQEIGWQTSVQKLRAILAQEVTYDLFENYSAIYRSIINESEIAEHEMQNISTKNKQLKKQMSNAVQVMTGGGLTGNKEQYKEMLAGAKVLNKKYNEIKKKIEIDNDLLRDFGFMANVKTIEDLRTYIRTANYWADTWAISTLERVLEIKIIILEETTDPNAVMQCGQLNDEMTTFSPKYYILANYTGGNHYELVTYKKKGLFIFSEIPYGIKILVVNKCMERNAGPYAIIPAFRQFQSDLGLEVAEPSDKGDKGEEVERSDLYDPKYQFVFYHKSDSSKKPGDGSGEKPIPKNELTMFVGLIQKPVLPWRQQLDDQWSNAAFTVDHLRWTSVAHYLIALPFRKSEPTIYKAFSLDGSDKDLSTDIKAAREAIDKKKGKSGKYYDKYKIVSKSGELGEDDIETARKNALMAKFSQNADLTTMLLDTRNALLKQYHSGKEATADILLMTVRKSLKGNGN